MVRGWWSAIVLSFPVVRGWWPAIVLSHLPPKPNFTVQKERFARFYHLPWSGVGGVGPSSVGRAARGRRWPGKCQLPRLATHRPTKTEEISKQKRRKEAPGIHLSALLWAPVHRVLSAMLAGVWCRSQIVWVDKNGRSGLGLVQKPKRRFTWLWSLLGRPDVLSVLILNYISVSLTFTLSLNLFTYGCFGCYHDRWPCHYRENT